MRKLNNKGFAIASILYSIMVLFLLLLLSILGILGNRKAILDKNKKDILEELNKEVLYNRINFEHKNITIINRGNIDDIRFALLDGVTALDSNGNTIGTDKINYNLDLTNIENKSYYVTYTVNQDNKNITSTRQITFVPDSTDYTNNFDYTGDSQTFTTKYDGSYKVELWGAQGGSMTGTGYRSDGTSRGELTYTGGKGAYTNGAISLIKGKNIYLYIGGKGPNNISLNSCTGGDTGGYNGGGTLASGQCKFGSPGGGATDIRIANGVWNNFNSLKSRIMVAAGGGGANFRNQGYGEGNGGEGGSLIGINGYEALVEGSYFRKDWANGYGIGTGGTQTAGGYYLNYLLDGTIYHGNSYDPTNSSYGENIGKFGFGPIGNQSGGGSGYYGGGSTGHGGGGGGSSFISGYDGCDAIAENSTEDNIIHTGQSIHYSGYKFNNAVMYAGNEEMPTHDGTSTMIGNSGNGYAKISLIYYY